MFATYKLEYKIYLTIDSLKIIDCEVTDDGSQNN